MSSNPQSGITVLPMNVCWMLLRLAEVGRLAVVLDGRPEVFPINFVVDHGSVVFRTAAGTKLAAILARPDVAFEVDGYDSEAGEAWSVVIKGVAKQIKRIEELIETPGLPLFPWHAGPKHQFVRITPEVVSGRRFRVLDREVWHTALDDAIRSSPE